MARQTETARAQVYLDGKQAEAAIDALKQQSKELRTELSKAVKAGDQETITKLKKEIKGVSAATGSLKRETFDYNKVLKNLNGSSWLEIDKALRSVRAQHKKLKPLTKEDIANKAKLAKKIQILKTKQRELNLETRAYSSTWSKFSASFNKNWGLVTAGLAAVTGVAFSLSQMVKGLTGLDDALANVMKTTGLARSEVRGLYTDFRDLNTRTSKSILLEYAEEAGRLGKKGKADVMAFVKEANKIGVALGDDLGDAALATRTIGKMVNIYKVGAQYGVTFDEGMNKIGSGINEVAANSAAAAPYLVEYLNRMAGLAEQSDITSASIIGYASVLDQSGQKIEMSATAQNKIMLDMFTDIESYSEMAGMSYSDFATLLETDINEAFLTVLDGLNGSEQGMIAMTQKLDDLGVEGTRAIGVLSVLAGNTDKIRKEQALANKAMEEGVSLSNEYNIKNDNLAGSWEKLTKALRAKIVNPQLIAFMERFVSSAARLVEIPLSKTLKDQQTEVNELTLQLRSANLAEGEREQILTRINELAPKVAETLKEEKTSLEDVTKALSAYNDEMAMKILIAEGDEELAAKKLQVEAFKRSLLTNQATMAKEMNQSIDWFKKKAPEMQETAEGILYDTELTLLQKADRLNRLSMDASFGGNNALFLSMDRYRNSYKRYTDELHNMDTLITGVKNNKEEWEKIFGSSDDGGGYNGPRRPKVMNDMVVDDSVPKMDDDVDLKDIGLTDHLDRQWEARKLHLQKQYTEEGVMNEENKSKLLAAEVAYLMMKKDLLEANGEDTLSIENDIFLKEQALYLQIDSWKENQLQTQADIDAALLKMQQDADAEELAEEEKHLDEINKLRETDLAKQQRNAQMIVGIGQDLGTILGETAADSEATMDEFGKKMVLMALKVMKSMIPIWSAQIIGGSLATPQSIMTGGGAGLVQASILSGLMYAAVGGVEGVVKASMNSGYYSGGYTGTGNSRDVDNYVHKNEFVANHKATGNPDVRGVLDVIDIAQRNNTIGSLRVPDIITSVSRGYPTPTQGSSSTAHSANAANVAPAQQAPTETRFYLYRDSARPIANNFMDAFIEMANDYKVLKG